MTEAWEYIANLENQVEELKGIIRRHNEKITKSKHGCPVHKVRGECYACFTEWGIKIPGEER